MLSQQMKKRYLYKNPYVTWEHIKNVFSSPHTKYGNKNGRFLNYTRQNLLN